MSQLNTIITLLNGESFNLNSLGIVTRDFLVHSPEYEHETHEIEGRAGHVTTNTKIKARRIDVSFYMRSYDNGDYALARDELFPLFESRTPFYIADGRQPNRMWLVRQNGSFEMDQQGRYGFFDVSFIADVPFSRSKHKAGDPISWDAGTISWGDGYEWDELPPTNTFAANQFTVKNLGNVEIDSVTMPLLITLAGNFASSVTIRNKTTGSTFIYNGGLATGDTLTISGIKVLKNDAAVFRSTNRKMITLAPQLNEFEVIGGTVDRITFDHYYYYY